MDLTSAKWFKSRRSSDNGACVEVAMLGEGVAMRDTKNRDGGTLEFTHTGWADFISSTKNGEFDR